MKKSKFMETQIVQILKEGATAKTGPPIESQTHLSGI
jgi:hypothetical protein